ncbi:hypothetical protein ABZ891_18020 [Streptomyces sp. NPDC047023]|uniref:hypothetical protein n=1 Tax=Streptomyces sp. NPDC047023 TaxID=3155139 RepID=UPI0033C88DBE
MTDAEITEPVHHMLAARDLRLAERFLDSGNTCAELIVGMKRSFGASLVTPVLMNSRFWPPEISPEKRASGLTELRGRGREVLIEQLHVHLSRVLRMPAVRAEQETGR